MCSHYEKIREKERLERYFGVAYPSDWDPVTDDIWPQREAEFIRRPREANLAPDDDAVPTRELELGKFGLVPHWTKPEDMKAAGRNTFNARSETAATKPSFRDAWKAPRHCIIPCDAFYEPDWRSGKAISTRISGADGAPLGIAGLWGTWNPPGAPSPIYSFTMLTINADGHAIMQNMHKPEDEKRMVVILNPDSYDAWLKATPEESGDFLRLYPAEKLIAEPRPKTAKGAT